MNDKTTLASDEDWIESLLRADARRGEADYVDDDGFTARVMAAIPAPVALPAWRKPLLAGVWATAGIGLATMLPAAMREAAQDALQFIASQHFSLSDIGVVLLAIAGASWAGTLYALRQER